ncbi:dipeptide epimerase [Methylococcus geothermalis]|uniref:Dipeptide epimerase n=1 Tax=Methylococcus geothermalis TaxID=2681310 RepID=A0A858Q9A7_9GAMM|nr:dipeptide epimerase [Methylococcus geothermalis]QJD30286.1 dipeptide epimerase [Methylococcus geothermalis]
MNILDIRVRTEHFPLTRPYRIAFRSIDEVDNLIVEVRTTDGLLGLGAASPEHHVTGETLEACHAALSVDDLDWLIGRDIRTLPRLCRELTERLPAAPAARAALDMALHDLFAQALDLPLADVLGRAHDSLPTSVTIGIKPVEETLTEAREYLGLGFRVLKVKLSGEETEDFARLHRLHETLAGRAVMRVDPNQSYGVDGLLRLDRAGRELGIEFVEQPFPAERTDWFRALPEAVRRRVAADESLLGPADAFALAAPPAACGIFNIKLMKCGGLAPALRIAAIAETAGIALMWGCMDESRISIAAALHAALACPATRYLDLDGSFDLARDIAEGGFVLEDGRLSVTGKPGLGLKRLD